MVTLNILTEQINRLYSRFLDKDNKKLDDREVKLHISQVINTLFKMEYANGIDADAAIGSYLMTRAKDDTYYVDMPIYPIALPNGRGVHRVYAEGCPLKPYVPIRTGDFDIIQGTFTEFLEGQVGYYVEGLKIRFTRKVPDNIVAKLIVNDPNKVSGDQPLPVPRDMEVRVIEGVFNLLGMGTLSQAELNSKNEKTITNERER